MTVVCCQVEVSAKSLLLSRGVLPIVLCLSEILVPHRGGLDPLGPSSYEQKYIFIKSTECQAVEGKIKLRRVIYILCCGE